MGRDRRSTAVGGQTYELTFAWPHGNQHQRHTLRSNPFARRLSRAPPTVKDSLAAHMSIPGRAPGSARPAAELQGAHPWPYGPVAHEADGQVEGDDERALDHGGRVP